jgi:c-di-GMP-binding flagellar brake protein YcgR
VPQRRNLGGARREASERVILALHGSKGKTEIEAWTLNVSRGGLRVVVEDAVHVGGKYMVSVGDAAPRPATVVWIREEADGQIVGLKFEDVEGAEVPPSSFPPPA